MNASKTLNLAILGMKCSGCANAVKNALIELEGVNEVNVNVDDGEAKVELAPDASLAPEKLIETVKDAGYEATLSNIN